MGGKGIAEMLADATNKSQESTIGTAIATTAGASLGRFAGKIIAQATESGATLAATSQKLLGATAGTFGGAIAAALPWAGIIAAVVGGVYSIYSFIEKQILKDAQEAYQAAANSYTSKKTAAADVERYAKLAQGVNKLGENIGLTDEEYTEFLQVSNKLGDAFPELVSYVDEAGNKFINLGDSTSNLIEAVNGAVEDAQEAADITLNSAAIIKNSKKEAKKEANEYNDDITDYNTIKRKIKNGNLSNYKVQKFLKQYGIDTTETKYYAGNEEISKSEYDEFIARGDLAGVSMEEVQKKLTDEQLKKINNILDAQIKQATNNLNSIGEDLIQNYFSYLNQALDGFDLDAYMPKNMDSNTQALLKAFLGNGQILDPEKWDEQIVNVITSLANSGILDSDVIFEAFSNGVNNYATVGDYADVQNAALEDAQAIYDKLVADENYTDAQVKATMNELGYQITGSGKVVNDNIYTELLGIRYNSESKQLERVDAKNQIQTYNDMASAIAAAEAEYGANYVAGLSGLTSEEGAAALQIRQTKWGRSLSIEDLKEATHRSAAASDYIGDLIAYQQETQNQRASMRGAIAHDEFDAAKIDADKLKAMSESDMDEYSAENFGDFSINIQGLMTEYLKAYQEALNKGATEAELEELTQEFNVKFITQVDSNDIDASAEIVKAQLKDAFSNVDIGTDGLINNFSELKSVLDSVADSFSNLKDAQEEQNKQGHLSIQTALGLLASDSSYLSVIKAENGQLSLVDDAQEKLAKAKLLTAKAAIVQMQAETEQEIRQIESLLLQGEYVDTSLSVVDSTVAQIEATDDLTKAKLANAKASKAEINGLLATYYAQNGKAWRAEYYANKAIKDAKEAETSAKETEIDSKSKELEDATQTARKQVQLTRNQVKTYNDRYKYLTGSYMYETNPDGTLVVKNGDYVRSSNTL